MGIARLGTTALCFACVISVAAHAVAQPEPRPPRKGRKYKVRIDSAPQQAAIYLDDEKYGIVGYTPWEGRLQKGDWRVILKKDGYETATRVIRIERTSRTQETFVPLVKKEIPAVIDVRADADANVNGAEVWVDGQLQGTAPLLVKIDDGRHLVEIKKEGFQTHSQWVTAKEGERITMTPPLRPVKASRTGDILIDADVPGAEVWIDGNKHPDTTPTVLSGIVEGPHVVEVRAGDQAWKQSVEVEAGKTVKITAKIRASAGGAITVLSNVRGARVFLDGEDRGEVPLDLSNVSVGEHVIEVRAEGYRSREQRIKVTVGSAEVVKLDLDAQAPGGRAAVTVVSQVPEAVVFIDGERIGTVPQTKSLAEGEHFVVVKQTGYKTFERKIVVAPDKPMTVQAELLAAGGVRVLSSPAGATVLVDGESRGTTPLVLEDVEVGPHLIAVNLNGYHEFSQEIAVEGGQMKVVNAALQRVETGPTSEERKREQRGLVSLGARTLPRRRSTIDLAFGYPYFTMARITVGAGEVKTLGFDANVMFRTFLSRTEFGVGGRLRLWERDPFAIGVFADIGGGSSVFDDSKRNGFYFQGGGMLSLTALGRATVTGRAALAVFSDRHCPALQSDGSVSSDAHDTCIKYAEFAAGGAPSDFDQEDKDRIDSLVGEDGPFKRDSGVRAVFGVAVEVVVKQRWNVWLLFEGVPFQDERTTYTTYFNKPLLEQDVQTYVQLGVTAKF